MTLTRRSLLVGGIPVATATTLGLRWYASLDQRIARLISAEFGDKFAQEPDAKQFVRDLASLVRSNGEATIGREAVVLSFVGATNVIRAIETGEKLVFLGFAEPLDAPCRNTLSANWL